MAYTPVLGNNNNLDFDLQFRSRVDGRSVARTPIEYYDLAGGMMDLHASGFFYRSGESVALISARHCISGLDAFENKPTHKLGFLPHRILAYPYFRDHGVRVPMDLRVRSDDGGALWLEDPGFADYRTDVAAIEVEAISLAHVNLDPSSIFCLNDNSDERLMSYVGVDCFIIGYPSPSYSAPHLPVWRRGSMAYEPGNPIDNKPMFLIDAMTSSGMSGSPIIQRWHGPAPIESSDGLTVKLDNIVSNRFVGVYAGRIANHAPLAEVGYGWYANRIDHIMASLSAPAED